MIHFIRLTRPLNLLIAGLTMYGLGWYVESQYSNGTIHGVRSLSFFLLVFSTILIAAAGNVINDYFDVRADRINKPEKLIIGVHIKRRWAIISHWLMNATAFGIAIFLSLQFNTFWYVFIHLLSINLLWGYSMYFKRKMIVGNLIIAGLTALVPFLVGIYFDLNSSLHLSSQPDGFPYKQTLLIDINWTTSILLAYFAFTLNLAREIIKDIHDIEGDRVLKASTIPIKYGIRTAKLISYFILTACLAALFYLEFYFELSSFYATLPIWIATLFTVVALFSLVFADSRKQIKRVDLILKLAMVSGLIAPICWKLISIYHV